MENLQNAFRKKLEKLIPEKKPFSEKATNRLMTPEELIKKYGQGLTIKEIREKFQSTKDLSDQEIEAVLNEKRGVV